MLVLLLPLLLQAQLEQTLSYLTFKRLFRAGGYAYLHQVGAVLLQTCGSHVARNRAAAAAAACHAC